MLEHTRNSVMSTIQQSTENSNSKHPKYNGSPLELRSSRHKINLQNKKDRNSVSFETIATVTATQPWNQVDKKYDEDSLNVDQILKLKQEKDEVSKKESPFDLYRNSDGNIEKPN